MELNETPGQGKETPEKGENHERGCLVLGFFTNYFTHGVWIFDISNTERCSRYYLKYKLFFIKEKQFE